MLSRILDRIVDLMASLAGVLLLAMMVMIILDIFAREVGLSFSAHFFALTEYSLLIIPLLGGPWLVRERAHVTVEVLLVTLPPKARARLLTALCWLCIVTCLILAYFGILVTLDTYSAGDMDMRSFDMPRWMLFAFMPLSFGMMVLEFFRLWLRGEPIAKVGAIDIPNQDK